MAINDSLEFISGMMDRSVRLWLKPEYLAVIDSNLEAWQKIFWLGMLLAEHRPGIDKKYAEAKDNNWLVVELASFCELTGNKEDAEYLEAHARLSIQVLSIGLWAGLVTVKNIDGLDPIFDPELTQDKETEA